ncbi:MAG: hypothetical protein OK456_08930 [Thaumarchaeota archaeon]|nr:hypothetical protein [Nitrososphaerota archaeon]
MSVPLRKPISNPFELGSAIAFVVALPFVLVGWRIINAGPNQLGFFFELVLLYLVLVFVVSPITVYYRRSEAGFGRFIAGTFLAVALVTFLMLVAVVGSAV